MVPYYESEGPASPELIDQLGRQIGHEVPAEYREHLLQQDGGRLDNNDKAVMHVFGVGDVPDYMNIWENLEAYGGRIPSWLLPVASDEYGNLFAISLRGSDLGSVWFWDHEEEADVGEPPSEENIEVQAPSWSAFLADLQPV